MEELKRIQEELVFAKADAKVAKENADKLAKEMVALREKLAETVAFYSNIDNNPEILKSLYQKNKEVEQLREMLQQAQKEALINQAAVEERIAAEIRKKDIELMEQKIRYLKELIDEGDRYRKKLNEKESMIQALYDEIDRVKREQWEDKDMETNGLQDFKTKTMKNESRLADTLKTFNRAVDMSNIPSEEQDKVLKILGMTESQLKDTPPENYFGTRIGRTGAKEQVIYNFDLWMQYPVLNQDPSHLELNERYRINYAYGSPLVMVCTPF